MAAFDPERVAVELEARFRAEGHASRALQEKAYLKSDLEFAGAGVPAVRRATRAALKQMPPGGHDDVIALAEVLWAAPLHERRLATVEVLSAEVTRLGPADLRLVERLLTQAGTWALADPLAVDVAGPVVAAFPAARRRLDRWARAEALWVRRSSMLALLRPLREGGGDFERFARYADQMVGEKEFFIRKAIGWVLREVGKKRPELVVEWLEPRLSLVSGVTLREAVKYIGSDDRERLLSGR